MRKKIIFFTGARSDYGIMKSLLKTLTKIEYFDISLYVSGLHFLKEFGHTIDEIKADGFNIEREIDIFPTDREPNENEFSAILTQVTRYLKQDEPAAFFILGDRIESYAASLASHFAKTPIIHMGGGNITEGANDNIYRYNITNLAHFHFATSKNNYCRLKEIRIIENDTLFLTGSFAIDAIQEFKKHPKPITEFVSQLDEKNFCLMTFHSSTKKQEDIATVMDFSIDYIIEKGLDILLTYPNNDKGYQTILEVIKKWKNHKHVHVKEHLGAIGYYAALNDTKLVIGNSSSGLIEAPYFQKPIINIGTRQEGRDCDEGITSVKCSIKDTREAIEQHFNANFKSIKNNNLFGDGNTVKTTINLLKQLV